MKDHEKSYAQLIREREELRSLAVHVLCDLQYLGIEIANISGVTQEILDEVANHDRSFS